MPDLRSGFMRGHESAEVSRESQGRAEKGLRAPAGGVGGRCSSLKEGLGGWERGSHDRPVHSGHSVIAALCTTRTQ